MSTERIIVAGPIIYRQSCPLGALPGGYANLLADDAREQIRSAFGPNGQRLLNLKARFDPGNIFSARPLPSVVEQAFEAF